MEQVLIWEKTAPLSDIYGTLSSTSYIWEWKANRLCLYITLLLKEMPEWQPSTQKCTRASFQSSLVYCSSIYIVKLHARIRRTLHISCEMSCLLTSILWWAWKDIQSENCELIIQGLVTHHHHHRHHFPLCS